MMLEQVLAQGRAAAEARMLDHCVITVPGTGEPVFDPDTGTYTDPAPDTVYDGKCRVKAPKGTERTAEYGGREVTTQDRIVDVPISDSDTLESVPPRGAEVTVTACRFDPALVGREYTLIGPVREGQTTARSLLCEAVI